MCFGMGAVMALQFLVYGAVWAGDCVGNGPGKWAGRSGV